MGYDAGRWVDYRTQLYTWKKPGTYYEALIIINNRNRIEYDLFFEILLYLDTY